MSLMPLGLLSQGGGASGGNALTLISTAYGTGSSATISFSSIPSTYKHLQLRWTARSDSGANTVSIFARPNADVNPNYSNHELLGNGSTVTSVSNLGYYQYFIGEIPTSSYTTSSYAAGILDLLDYKDTNKYKTIRAMAGRADASPGAGYANVRLMSGSWRSTAAVSSLDVYTTGNFLTGVRVSLYGVS